GHQRHRRDPVRPGIAGLRLPRRVPFLALVAVLSACSGTATGAAPSPAGSVPPAVNLTIYAAASLSRALDAAKAAYEAATPGVTLTVSTDSSSALETQIEQGAPADVFLSADTANPRKLVDAGLADGTPVTFARNDLTIVVPAGNPAGITSPADLARAGVKIIAAGDTVPITTYAAQLVRNLSREPGYPADFVTAYEANVASKEDNVRAVVAKIELGEGDAAIVYATDAKASGKVAMIEVPDAANVPATYDGVVIGTSGRAAAARAFLDWFAGAGGRPILAGLGFLPPS
ncbi:MAG TPA: molybdate ABC transporter substrate-binding protein, partial [Candidatus Limnocylindrales bacterium]